MKIVSHSLFLAVLTLLLSCCKTENDNSNCNISVSFEGTTAFVTSDNQTAFSYIEGADVALDLSSPEIKNAIISLSGNTTDGSIKVYSAGKFSIVLNGIAIESRRGPAINSQSCEKMELRLADGTNNSLTDCEKYKDDCYYKNPGKSEEEDRKGCIFSEGSITICGNGALSINANHKHAIHSDDIIFIEGNPSISILGAGSNGISSKGKKGEGITIDGGTIYARLSNDGGKCIKSDGIIRINGGNFDLCSSADGYYDYDKIDKIYSSCIKSDTNIFITGGNIKASCTGWGGKVIRSKSAILISGGDLDITTIRPQAEGIESKLAAKKALVIDGGNIKLDCYKNCINSNGQIVINGGEIYAIGRGNDAIDSNFKEPGAVTINGGNIMAFCSFGSPQEGIDTEGEPIVITGGTTFSLGGTQMDYPPMPVENKSTQYTACLTSLSFQEGQTIEIRIKGESTSLLSVKTPFPLLDDYSIVSIPQFKKNVTYEVYIDNVLVKTFTFTSKTVIC